MQPFQSILVLDTTPTTDSLTDYTARYAVIDTLLLKPEPHSIGIDQIKQAIAYAPKRPLKSERKAIIITNAHTLTLEAQNALLKLLEEPPAHVDIILIATHHHTLVETILSRCHLIRPQNQSAASTPADTKPYQDLISQKPPQRLEFIPKISSAQDAISWCQTMITAAQTLHQNQPTMTHHTNLKLLHQCLICLKANTNPNLTVTDTLLHLVA